MAAGQTVRRSIAAGKPLFGLYIQAFLANGINSIVILMAVVIS